MDEIQAENLHNFPKSLHDSYFPEFPVTETFEKWSGFTNKNARTRTHPQPNIDPYHPHNFFEINYVFKGSCFNIVENHEFFMKENDLIILHPGTFHCLTTDDSSVIINILARSSFIFSKFSNLSTSSSPLWKFLDSAGKDDYYKYIFFSGKTVHSIIADMVEEEYQKYSNNAVMNEALFTTLIILLLREDISMKLSSERGYVSTTVSEVLQYIYDNFSTVTLKDAAEKFHYSESYLSKIFSKQVGKSFINVVTSTKMQHAIKYLVETDKKINEISILLGYESNAYFQKFFKKIFGITPMDFRNQARSLYGEELKEFISTTQMLLI